MLTSHFLLLFFWHTAHLCLFSCCYHHHHHHHIRHYHHYPMSKLYLFSHIFIPFSFSFSWHYCHSSVLCQTQLPMQGLTRTFWRPAGKIRLCQHYCDIWGPQTSTLITGYMLAYRSCRALHLAYRIERTELNRTYRYALAVPSVIRILIILLIIFP